MRPETRDTASLHFSPRGEVKCVRGPSGQGASRLARAGVLEQYVEHGKQAQRSHGGRIVCFDRRVVRNAGYCLARGASQREFRGFHETRITRHESRLLCFSRITAFFRPGCATGGATGNRRPDHCPRRQTAVFQFAIVHHCSLLFAIVQQKKLSCASVFAPPAHCFPAPVRVARCGYGAAWAAAVPRAGNTACKVSTNHESRNTAFPVHRPSDISSGANQSPNHGFYESRVTKHESRLLCFPPDTDFMPPENAFLQRDYGFLPPDYDFLPNHNGAKSRYSPQFFGIRRNSSDTQMPLSARRPPFSLGFPASAVRRGSRRPPGCFPLPRKIDEPKLRKEKVLYCV